ncbi:MAG: type II/IV secretion system protein, partial [Kiritimatiellae bacterium]|nr:type II/IV secretion system protein [Kiritimatiellia bacterium]
SAMDVRVATLPVKHGERVTLRLLSADRENLTLERLGMSGEQLATVERVLDSPHGLMLLTGPTGSGKTTTLYAAIRRLAAMQAGNILTVEDPIEYEIPGVGQAEVDSADKVSFSKALRSLLRHDPDVIMIGEIRDAESLDTAVKASLTGHLVLSTLHTNDAPGAVTRLLDMGLAPHLLAATLRLAMAQRLVRKLCPVCRRPYTMGEEEAVMLGHPELAGKTAWKPGGCLTCAGKGTRGRTGIFELLAPDSELVGAIARGAGAAELERALAARGHRGLAEDAIAKILDGTVTPGDVRREL